MERSKSILRPTFIIKNVEQAGHRCKTGFPGDGEGVAGCEVGDASSVSSDLRKSLLSSS